MKAIIMAAGKSTRTYPLTLTRPKPLLKVVNKPILAHQLDALGGLVDEALVVVGYRKEQIAETFGDAYNGIRLRYVEQKEQLGTGHAALQCAEYVDEPVLVMNGDDLYAPADLRRMAEQEQAALVKEVEDPRLYGIYEVTDGNRAVCLVEKPDDVFSNIANIGVYTFQPNVFEVLRKVEPSKRGEIEITSAVQMLAETSDFRVVTVEGYWLPIGYPWHLLEANEYFLHHHFEPVVQGKVSPLAEVNGAVHVGEGSEVRAGVVIDGPVYIGKNCKVGPNCWLRPGATLCDGAHVGHAVEIKNSILFDGAATPHLSYVGDSIIGADSNFGAGTITANLRHDGATVSAYVKGKKVDTGRRKLGAIVADDVHTGINSCLYPGRMLWPGTFTYPGEAVRKDVTEVERPAQH